jgi:hypothetical protein
MNRTTCFSRRRAKLAAAKEIVKKKTMLICEACNFTSDL